MNGQRRVKSLRGWPRRAWPVMFAVLAILGILAYLLMSPAGPAAPPTRASGQDKMTAGHGDSEAPPVSAGGGREGAANSPVAPTPEPPTKTQLRLMDVLRGAPLPQVPVVIDAQGGGTTGLESVHRVSDSEGLVSIPWERAGRVAFDSPNYRLVLEDSAYPNPRSGNDIWVLRLAEIRLTIESKATGLPCPEAEALVRSAARNTGEWISDPTRVGSPGWLDAQCPRLFTRPFDVNEPRQRVVVPASPEVVIVARAPGHYVARKLIRACDLPVEPMDVRLQLLPARSYSVVVRDESGTPIKNAAVTHVETFESRADEYSLEWTAAENLLTGQPITVQQTGDRVWYQSFASEASGGDGIATLQPPTPGTAASLVVTSPGFVPVVREAAPGDLGGAEPMPVVLKKVIPLVDRYVFVEQGKPLKGAKVYLVLKVGRWMAPVGEAILDDEGAMQGNLVSPGVSYSVYIQDAAPQEGGRHLRGTVVFDRNDHIEVSGFGK